MGYLWHISSPLLWKIAVRLSARGARCFGAWAIRLGTDVDGRRVFDQHGHSRAVSKSWPSLPTTNSFNSKDCARFQKFAGARSGCPFLSCRIKISGILRFEIVNCLRHPSACQSLLPACQTFRDSDPFFSILYASHFVSNRPWTSMALRRVAIPSPRRDLAGIRADCWRVQPYVV